MAISVVMPALEMAQETGKLISWLKKEGETVTKGEPLLEIETDKAVMELESPGDGVLAGIKAQAGAEVPVGRTIAWIVRPGEAPPADEALVESGRKTIAATPAVAPSVALAQPAVRDVKLSPKARRLATELGVNLSGVKGSGPDGEILAADVQAASTSVAAPLFSVPESSSPIARLMAERTTRSWTTVPHFFLMRDVDASAFNEAREKLAAQVERSHGARLTHTDLLVSLVARVLLKHPRINASWEADGVRPNTQINVSVAIAVEDGVVAPVIHSANEMALDEIAIRRRDLVDRARSGKLHPQDIAGGTFTISNLGMFGVDAFMAIITAPQAAILAVGKVRERVVAVNGQSAIRPIMTLTLSTDHRVASGATAAKFLRDVAEAISDPYHLLAAGS